ncbi:cysteine proteinase [Anaeromyces robustus]|uniref:Ubiquitin carboxyl-terminal hydrolase n=1 Tax=Anaeromyces robustus TaxID=1754192 RepID=A0A1Y1X721_9FUNG|nr:cysteine proteinase [Anaeromyces robustus]|eukprot:ORX81525.1 cysteine proteinase [Anaeromyces robustus]
MTSENPTPISTPNQTTIIAESNNTKETATPKISSNNTIKSTFSIFRTENLHPAYHGCTHISARINNLLMENYRICCRYSIRFRNKYVVKQEIKLKSQETKVTTTKKSYSENLYKSLNKLPLPFCHTCGNPLGRLHVCLICVYFGCWKADHMRSHCKEKSHNFAMNFQNCAIYCYECEDYIYDLEFEKICRSEEEKFYQLLLQAQNPNIKYLTCDEWLPTEEEAERIRNNSTLLRCSGLRGLRNLGSTCFMNVIIQSFIHNPLLRAHFLGDRHNYKLCKNQLCLACELDKLFTQFYSGDHTPYGPCDFLYVVWKTEKHMAGYQQQDAHEFLICALDQLHQSCCILKNRDDSTKCKCIIHQIFSGSLRSEVTCSKCGTISVKEDLFMDLSLDIKDSSIKKSSRKRKHKKEIENDHVDTDDSVTNDVESVSSLNSTLTDESNITLADCLNRFTIPEKISEKYMCTYCDSYQDATKQLSLKTLPPVLCISLKRFEHSHITKTKIETMIKIPYELDLTPYTSPSIEISKKENQNNETLSNKKNENLPPNPLNFYKLFAVTVHNGSLETGHYTAFAKCHGEWFKFDDQTITLASEQEVLESNAYMCFYIRNVMNYGSIENSGMIPVNFVKSEKEKAALAKEKEKEEKAALKKAKKLKKEAEANAASSQTKKRKNNQLLSESPSKPKHIKLTSDAKNSLEKSIHKSIKTEKSLSTSKSSKPHSTGGGKTLPKIKKEYASSLLSDDDEETYTVLASGKSSYTEVIGKGYSNGSIHKSLGGKVKPGSNSSLNRNNSNYNHDRTHSYGQSTNGNPQKSNNSKQRKKGSETITKTNSINNKSNDTNHNKNILDSLLTDDDDDDLDEISSLTDISSSPEEVFVMASDHI